MCRSAQKVVGDILKYRNRKREERSEALNKIHK